MTKEPLKPPFVDVLSDALGATVPFLAPEVSPFGLNVPESRVWTPVIPAIWPVILRPPP